MPETLVSDAVFLGNETISDGLAWSCTLVPEGDPTMDKAAVYADRFRRVAPLVRARSHVRQGFLIQAGIGHGWTPGRATPWQKLVTADGGTSYRFCPLGEEFRRYISEQARTLAAEKPDFFMVDDDTRLLGAKHDGCFCPLHLAGFAEKTGRTWSREELVAALEKGYHDVSLAWREYVASTLVGYVRLIRAAFPDTIPGSFCTTPMSAGRHDYVLPCATVLAGPGFRPVVRIGSAPYWSDGLYDILRIRRSVASQLACLGSEADALVEADTCPQVRWQTSATRALDHLTILTAEGCRGAKMWWHRMSNPHETQSSSAYLRALGERTGTLRWLSDSGFAASGVWCPLGGRTEWGEDVFGFVGIPYHYGPRRTGDVAALTADSSAGLDGTTLTNILSGPVVLDGSAAIALTRRGFGPLIGVSAKPWSGRSVSYEDFGFVRLVGATGSGPADLSQCADGAEVLTRLYNRVAALSDETSFLAPGSIRYVNKLGGRILTLAAAVPKLEYLTNFGYCNETRRDWLLKMLAQLAGRLPGGVAALGDQPILCEAGRTRDGEEVFILDNLDLDVVENPELVFAELPSSVDRLTDDGRWERVGLNGSAAKAVLAGVVLTPHRPAVFRLNRSAPSTGGAFGERVVSRTDFDVGASWKAKKVAGREFFIILNSDGQTWTGYGKEAPYPVYRECGRLYSTRRLPGMTELVKASSVGKKGYAALGTEKLLEKPYRLYDLFAKRHSPAFADKIYSQEETDRPLMIELDGCRPAFLLNEKYPLADRADFEKWRAEHPNFAGFHILSEFDSDSCSYFINFRSTEDIEALKRLEKAYPCTFWDYASDVWFENTWMRTALARSAEYNFGCKTGWGMPSSEPGMIPLYARLGVTGVRYEATTQGGDARWSIGGAFLRGAARQWDIPYGWYTANFYTGCKRGSTKLVSGENSFVGTSETYKFFGPHRGASFSLIMRQNLYGWLTGATCVEPENWGWYHKRKLEDGTVEPTQAAADLQALHDLAKRVDRGVPYTPMAVMVPVNERVGNAGSVHNFASLRQSAALATLVPGYPVENHRLQGLEGGFYNSPFPEFWDVVVNSDSSPKGASVPGNPGVEKRLASYRALVVVGVYADGRKVPYGLSHGLLARYAQAGGTVFASEDLIRRGCLLAQDAGVDFTPKGRFIAGRYLVDDLGQRMELTESYVVHEGTPTTAKVLWRDEKGVPLAYVNNLGKGRIVTVCVDGMMPDGLDGVYGIPRVAEYRTLCGRLNRGEIKCDLMAAVFRRIQAETMPFTVDGDIQWGVNVVEGNRERGTGNRWLVWMFNNKGVTNYLDEEPVIDHACDAKVVVTGANGVRIGTVRDLRTTPESNPQTLKPSNNSFEVTVPAGGWTAYEVVESR